MPRRNHRYLILSVLIVVGLILLLLYLKREQDKAPADISLPASLDYLPAASLPVIRHTHFMLAYSEENKQALWVAYELTRQEIVQQTAERSDNFREDTLIATGTASPDDYRRSGYDRGHLAPAGDMGFDAQAMSESFYMSNISPQVPAFNRGIWKDLEEDVRQWALQDGSLYVVTGPVFAGSSRKIGEHQVTVPTAFYKVLLSYHPPRIRAFAFLIPNQGTEQPVLTFAVTIDAVEETTGIDFFPALPDELENELESTIAWSSNSL